MLSNTTFAILLAGMLLVVIGGFVLRMDIRKKNMQLAGEAKSHAYLEAHKVFARIQAVRRQFAADENMPANLAAVLDQAWNNYEELVQRSRSVKAESEVASFKTEVAAIIARIDAALAS